MTGLLILGGLGLFLYGISLVAEHLQALLGTALQRALRRARTAPWLGVLMGALVTAAAQSATAIGVMTASLMRGGVLQFREALTVMLGSALGATVAVQLVSFRVQEAAIPLVALGFVLLQFPQKLAKQSGHALLGLGLAFLGLQLMLEGLAPVRQSELLQDILEALENAPLVLLVFGVLLTLVLHSSNAPVVLSMAFVSSEIISPEAALAVVLGANLGTPINVYLMTLGQGIEVQRTTIAHIGIKFLALLPAFLGIPLLLNLLEQISPDASRSIANAHSLFNLAAALLVLPFLLWLENWLRRILPDPPQTGPRPKYLDSSVLDSPDLAYSLAFREMARICDHVLRMAKATFEVRESNSNTALQVRAEEDMVDTLVHEVVKYIAKLAPHLPENRLHALLAVCTSLEGIGDLLKRLLRQNNKVWSKGLRLSGEGQEEIQQIAQLTLEKARHVLTALSVGNVAACQQAAQTSHIEASIQRSRQAHLSRLYANREESILTSSVHLDTLTLFEQINTELGNIANRADAAFFGANGIR